jgi:YVTN family beta-propeller protein
VFSFNGKSNNVTVIDASNNTVVGMIPLGGSPAFAVADGNSHIYVSLEHKNVTLELDSKAMTVLKKIPLAPCETPAGLAMDRGTRRLFVGCDNKLLAVLDADAGKVITTLPIGEGNDAVVFEPETNLIFASNADGTMNVFHEDDGDKYPAVQTVATNPRSKTMMVDRKTHHALVPAAEYLPKPDGAERAPVKPGSFRILVIGR